MQQSKAAFFDRDGTLIHDVGYLARLDDIVLLKPGIAKARDLHQQGYLIIIVTNQSGIARGFFDEAFVRQTHDHLATLLAQHGIPVTAFYFCPHHPGPVAVVSYQQDCGCRKPKPGMLLQAAQDFGLDLSMSLMFGDKESDVAAGRAAGCRSFMIV